MIIIIIISNENDSGIETTAHVRGPYDLMNIGEALQLTQQQSENALFRAWRHVLRRGASRKHKHVSIDIISQKELIRGLQIEQTIKLSEQLTEKERKQLKLLKKKNNKKQAKQKQNKLLQQPQQQTEQDDRDEEEEEEEEANMIVEQVRDKIDDEDEGNVQHSENDDLIYIT